MTVVDFIDVIDDIIDLSSDEETVQQEHIATEPRATLLDRQAAFVLAGEGRQDVQAAFVSAGEGSQEAAESGNASVASGSPSFMENETGNVSVSTGSPSVMENEPLDTVKSKNCPSFPATVLLPGPTSTTLKALTCEVGDTQLVTTTSPSVMEKAHLFTAASNNSFSSPASAPLPSPASTTPKALTSEEGDTKLARVKHPKKNYHTSTPRRSPRLHEFSVEELEADHKRSRML